MVGKIVGHLQPHTSGAGKKGYLGEISFAYCAGKIALAPVDEKRKPTSPDYRVMIERNGHGWRDYGAAFSQEVKAGPNAGTKFFSLAVDHETMGEPVRFAVFFPNKDDKDKDKRLVIVWGRPKGGTISADARAEYERERDDEIPY
jgi:uncharacterized protein (DUF736 family)